MDPCAKQILTDAFNRHGLAAMHVDLQDWYYDIMWNYAFENAAKLSDLCRDIGVENIWIAYSSFRKEKMTPADFNGKHGEPRHFKIVRPLDEELLAYTMENGYHTFLETGVYFDECVTATMLGGLTKNPRCVFIVVRDATDRDCSNDYLRRKLLAPYEQSGRILYTPASPKYRNGRRRYKTNQIQCP